jgi:hypothetical protein
VSGIITHGLIPECDAELLRSGIDVDVLIVIDAGAVYVLVENVMLLVAIAGFASW